MRILALSLCQAALAVQAHAVALPELYVGSVNTELDVNAAVLINDIRPRTFLSNDVNATIDAEISLDSSALQVAYDKYDVVFTGSSTNTQVENVTTGIGQSAAFTISLTITGVSLVLPPSGTQGLSPTTGGIYEVQETTAFTQAIVTGELRIQGPTTNITQPFVQQHTIVGNRNELRYDLDTNGYPKTLELTNGFLVITSAQNPLIFNGTVDGAQFQVNQAQVQFDVPNIPLNQVPEPASIAVLALGALACARRRSR